MELLHLDKLKYTKNLLAFSAGVDSSALFYLLHQHNIDFDIIIVNYNLREQSKEEVKYAQELATFFSKKCFVHNVNNLSLDTSNLEEKCRNIRYSYFQEIYAEYSYDNLLIGHQLNDRLEWLLMQFSKGSGLNELLSMNSELLYGNMQIYKPLFNTSRNEIEQYLNDNTLPHFIDETNFHTHYQRNEIRNSFVNEFVKKYTSGVKNTFKYLNNDKKSIPLRDISFTSEEFNFFEKDEDETNNFRTIQAILKKQFNKSLSHKEFNEIVKSNYNFVISNRINIELSQDGLIYICEFIADKKINLSDKQKEFFKLRNVPLKTRRYFAKYFFEMF